jgi:hypothetical protein
MERLAPPPDIEGGFRKVPADSEGYAPALVQQFTEFRGDSTPELGQHIERAEISLERNEKAARLGGHAIEQAAARAFYETMIRPYLLKGTLNSGTKEKTFVPDGAYVDDFVERLCEGGAVSQMYIRLLQSRPGEAPTDSRVSFAAMELLRTWSLRALVAKELGLNYGVHIIDETGAFDHGDTLGFTPDAVSESHQAMTTLLNGAGLTEEDFSITPFSHQASLYRGTDRDSKLGDEYDGLLEANIEKTKSDLRLGIFSLNAIRAVMIHKLRHGDRFTNVSANTDLGYLTQFNENDIEESLLVSESFNSALEMRTAAKRHVGQAGLIAAFPEFYSGRQTFHWGISKKGDRISMQPNFKVYKGRLVTPGYALPVYSADGSEFFGLTSYAEHANDSNKVIFGPNGLPAALIKEDAM